MDLYFALYRSTATSRIRQRDVLSILSSSLRNNARDTITGFLHSDHGHYLQYLEGPHAAVMRKLAVIQRDPRHRDFRVLADGTLDERLFRDWDMGEIDMMQDCDVTGALLNNWQMRDAILDPVPLLLAFSAKALGAGAVEVTAAE